MTMINPIDVQQIISGTESVPRGILSRNHDQLLSNVDHPLKGLLRDKGRKGHSVEEILRLYQRAADKVEAACIELVKHVRDKNTELDGGLLNLKYNGKSIFQWRVNGKLSEATGGQLKRTGSVHPFNTEHDDYIIVDLALREHGNDIKNFYRAADNISQELGVRHQMIMNVIRVLKQHITRGSKSSVISPRAEKVSEDMLRHIWGVVESEKNY